MKFKTYSNKNKPVFVYIHGECLSAFSFKEEIKELKKDFQVVLPILDGHDVAADEEFIDIDTCAIKILDYIDKHFQGHIQVLSGFSLGGQIAVQMLSKRPNLCEYAMIESTMVKPTRIKNWSAYASVYANKLAKQKWFNKFMYYTIFNDDFAFEDYYKNYKCMSKDNIKHVLDAHSTYNLGSQELKDVTAKVAILVGQREKKAMKKSADLLKSELPNAEIFMLMNFTYGDFSLGNPREYLRFVKSWVQNKDSQQRKKADKIRQEKEGEYMPNWKHLLNKIKEKRAAKTLQKS